VKAEGEDEEGGDEGGGQRRRGRGEYDD